MLMLSDNPSPHRERPGQTTMACSRPAILTAAVIALLGGLSGPAAAQTAEAATVTSTIGVTSTVQATCVTTATPLAFGTYTGTQTDGTATISVTCTNTTPYTVGLNVGLGTGATITTRHMTGATVALNYALYNDAARTINWGDTAPAGAMAGTATGAAQTLTVYGREPAGQFVAPGVYTDTITATVTY